MSISNRLSQGDNVRNHALHFKTPEMASNPSETCLNLIRNINCTMPSS